MSIYIIQFWCVSDYKGEWGEGMKSLLLSGWICEAWKWQGRMGMEMLIYVDQNLPRLTMSLPITVAIQADSRSRSRSQLMAKGCDSSTA